MDALPEELVAQIISHIHNHTRCSPPGPHPYPATPTLYALCLTSRKLHRVATPYLYTSIHSTSGAMCKALYQTLLASDDDNGGTRSSLLGNHVREIAVQHAVGGGSMDVDERDVQDAEPGKTFGGRQTYLQRMIALVSRLKMGRALCRRLLACDSSADTRSSSVRNHVREVEVQYALGGGVMDIDERGPPAAGFDVCHTYLVRTIAMLPRLEVLDLSRLGPPTEGSNNWLAVLWDASYARGHEGDWAQGTGFGNVKRLALYLGDVSGEAFWVVFRLPALRELEVDIRDVSKAGSWGNGEPNDRLWPVGTSGVEVLRIIGLWGGWARPNDVKRMSRACRALSGVFVAVGGMGTVKLVPHLFKQHVESGVLEQLQIVVQGLWEYEMSVLSGEVLDKLFDEHAPLGEEMMALMIHAMGHYGMGTKDCCESERVKITSMRELSADEKKAYDMRLARRP